MILELEQSPVFICGMHRSGTTLLQGLLDGHPELIVDAAESEFFRQFVLRVKGLTENRKIALAQKTLFRHLDQTDHYNQTYLSHISYELVQNLFLKRLSRGRKQAADYLTAAVLAYGEASGQLSPRTRYWVEKTPHNEQYANQIFSWWRNAKCLHVIRDPRDHYTTLKRRSIRNQRPIKPIDAFVYSWLKSINLLRKNKQAFGDDRYLGIRYEDLVQNPTREMGRVAGFLGIGDHESLYVPTKAAGKYQWKGNSSYDAGFKGIDSSSVGRWREQLEQEEVSLLEALLAQEMVKYNYRPETSISFGLRLKAAPYKGLNIFRTVRSTFKSL